MILQYWRAAVRASCNKNEPTDRQKPGSAVADEPGESQCSHEAVLARGETACGCLSDSVTCSVCYMPNSVSLQTT
jgi:hypothetical protein